MKILISIINGCYELIAGIISGLLIGLGIFVPTAPMAGLIIAGTTIAAAYAYFTSGDQLDVQYYGFMGFMALYAVSIWRKVWADLFP